MKKEITALTILDTLFKWRKLGIIIVAGTAIAVTGELTGLASKPEVDPAPVEVAKTENYTAAPAPQTSEEMLKVAAARQVEKCDRDWLPSTCAKMRADFKAEFGWEL